MNNGEKINLEPQSETFTRRNFLKTSAIFTATAFLAACGLTAGTKNINTNQTASSSAEPAKSAILEPTAQCGVDHEPSLALTEGPYFTPNSPERSSLLSAGMEGTS